MTPVAIANAGIAQSVEQLMRNQQVACSSHVSSSNPRQEIPGGDFLLTAQLVFPGDVCYNNDKIERSVLCEKKRRMVMKIPVKKRLQALVLALLMLLSLTGCGAGGTVMLDEAGSDISLVNEKMSAYLGAELGQVLSYASGKSELSYPNAITLSWTLEGAEAEFYRVRVSETENMDEAWVVEVAESALELYNCKTGTTYYWSVTAVKGKREVAASAVGTFSTAEGAPRTIYCDGVANMRDLGGWKTENGQTVKQGFIYRCGRLNENDNATVVRRITDEGLRTMQQLGIRTELDLREVVNNEVGGLTDTSLIDGAQYVQVPMDGTRGTLRTSNEAAIAEVFALLGDEANYPMIIHCSIGTDRTGFVCYLINGLLGVCAEDLDRDYLLSNFGAIGSFRHLSRIQDDYLDYIQSLPGETLSAKIEGYLLSIGVAQADMDTLRRVMLG